MRLIFHTGFHKTGTTSLQHTLRDNAEVICPHLRVFTNTQLRQLANATLAYSTDISPKSLKRMRILLQEFLMSLDSDDPRPVLVSSEDLCGHLPGHFNVKTYAAASVLMRALTNTVRRTLGNEPDLHFALSTRRPESWLRSCYNHNLRALRLTDTFEDYAARYKPAANLAQSISEIRARVGPTPVHVLPMEEAFQDPYGLLSPVLSIAGVSASLLQTLSIAPHSNRSEPPDLLTLYREANGSNFSDNTVRNMKYDARLAWLKSRSKA